MRNKNIEKRNKNIERRRFLVILFRKKKIDNQSIRKIMKKIKIYLCMQNKKRTFVRVFKSWLQAGDSASRQ